MTARRRMGYEGVAVAVPVTVPYERYSTNGAHWFVGQALASLVRESGIDKAQIDEALDSSKMPNISIVQEATPSKPEQGKRSKIALGILGAMGDEDLTPRPDRRYADNVPYGAGDPNERLELLRRENLEATLLYPTIGLLWEVELTDPGLAQKIYDESLTRYRKREEEEKQQKAAAQS